jgi:hypothetical protein
MADISISMTARRSGADIRRNLAVLAGESLWAVARVVEMGQIVALRAELTWRRGASGAHWLLVDVATVLVFVEDETVWARLDGEVGRVQA